MLRLKKVLFVVLLLIVTKTIFATTFYIDPINGDNAAGDGSASAPWGTLEYVVNNNLIGGHAYVTPYDGLNPQVVQKNIGAPIQEGDTLLLLTGLHGEIFIQNYINSDYITIKAAEGHLPVIEKWWFQGAKNWIVEGLVFSSEPYGIYLNDRLLFLESHGWQGPVTDIVIRGNHFYSTTSPWTTASEWVNNVSNGIHVAGNRVLVEYNTIENIGFGITLRGDDNQATGNSITNFSGDGIRVLGSNILVEANTIKNCYKVDANHDDGIQAFTTGGLVVDSNRIINNVIVNYEDPNQPLLGDLQGIGCFDGPFNDWVIENNIINVNHWHGISMYGANNCRIINNTVVDPDPENAVGPSWILIEDDGSFLASNCVVKNNISNSLSINPNSNTVVGDNLLLLNSEDYSDNFVDYANRDFNLIHDAPAIDNADELYAPSTDIAGTDRPQGEGSDIGAYEYLQISNTASPNLSTLGLYPVPAKDILYVTQELKDVIVIVYDHSGRKIDAFRQVGRLRSIDVSTYPEGVYTIAIKSRYKNHLARFIKL